MMHRCLFVLALCACIRRNHHQQTLQHSASVLNFIGRRLPEHTATDVFVGNMPYGMSDDYVKDLVYTVRKDDGSPVNPEVLRVTVPRDEETGKDRGLAFVKVLDATQAAGFVRKPWTASKIGAAC